MYRGFYGRKGTPPGADHGIKVAVPGKWKGCCNSEHFHPFFVAGIVNIVVYYLT
jgi:hypothetical protein